MIHHPNPAESHVRWRQQAKKATHVHAKAKDPPSERAKHSRSIEDYWSVESKHHHYVKQNFVQAERPGNERRSR